MQTCRVRERAHKSRRAAVFSSRSGSEQGMHWSRGNGTKTCRYIKVASLHVGIRSKEDGVLLDKRTWTCMACRIRAEAARLPALVAGASLQPCTRLQRLARNGSSQAAGLAVELGHTPTPARVSQPMAFSRSPESRTCAAGRRVSSRRKPRTRHLHRRYSSSDYEGK